MFSFIKGDPVVETKATLKVVRTRLKGVLIYSKIDTMQSSVRYLGHKL